MKILLANYRYFVSGGPERYMFNVKKALEERNYEIVPFSVTYPENEPCDSSRYFVPPLGEKNEVYFDQQKMTPATFGRTLTRLVYAKDVERSVLQLVDAEQPRIAFVLHYLRKISPSLLVALKKRNIPIVVRLSDYGMVCPQNHCLRDGMPCTLCVQGDIMPSIKYGCVKNSRITSLINAGATWFHQYKGYFNLIDKFMTTNRFMSEMMVRAGWPANKLMCIPTFTDTALFTPSDPAAKSNYICYIGRIEEMKGVHTLIRAFAAYKSRTKNDVLLKIAGTGANQYMNNLKENINKMGMKNHILFVGRLDASRIPSFLGRAQLSVVPSIWFENMPNSIIESLSCGTPVVASDIGSLRDCIKSGCTGELFTTGNHHDLAATLEALLNAPALLKKMAVNARAHAVRLYSAKSHLNALEHLFHSLL